MPSSSQSASAEICVTDIHTYKNACVLIGRPHLARACTSNACTQPHMHGWSLLPPVWRQYIPWSGRPTPRAHDATAPPGGGPGGSGLRERHGICHRGNAVSRQGGAAYTPLFQRQTFRPQTGQCCYVYNPAPRVTHSLSIGVRGGGSCGCTGEGHSA